MSDRLADALRDLAAALEEGSWDFVSGAPPREGSVATSSATPTRPTPTSGSTGAQEKSYVAQEVCPTGSRLGRRSPKKTCSDSELAT